MKREGSIERREDVNEQELTVEDVRQKLQKRSLLHPKRAPRPRQKEPSPDSKPHPPSAHLPPSPPPPAPVPPVPHSGHDKHHSAGREGKDGSAPREEEHTPPGLGEREMKGKRGASTVSKEGDASQEREEEHRPLSLPSHKPSGRGKERKQSPPDQPLPQSVDEGSGGGTMERKGEGGEVTAATSLPQMVGEESEAKLRERLILKTKHIRMGGDGGSTGVATGDKTELPSQPKVIEASTGMLYEEQEGEGLGGGEGGRGRGERGLIRPGFGQIQVSYDRVEPETGESENVAVGGVGGRRGKVAISGAGLDNLVQDEAAMQGSTAASAHKVGSTVRVHVHTVHVHVHVDVRTAHDVYVQYAIQYMSKITSHKE